MAHRTVIAEEASEFRMECLTLDDVTDLAAGIVPRTIQATARQLLDFEDLIRRNAQKPIKKSRAGGTRHAPQERER